MAEICAACESLDEPGVECPCGCHLPCPHDSLSGDEGPVIELGRMPTRWRCDECGTIINDVSTVQAAVVATINVIGTALLGSDFAPISSSPIPDEEVVKILARPI